MLGTGLGGVGLVVAGAGGRRSAARKERVECFVIRVPGRLEAPLLLERDQRFLRTFADLAIGVADIKALLVQCGLHLADFVLASRCLVMGVVAGLTAGLFAAVVANLMICVSGGLALAQLPLAGLAAGLLVRFALAGVSDSLVREVARHRGPRDVLRPMSFRCGLAVSLPRRVVKPAAVVDFVLALSDRDPFRHWTPLRYRAAQDGAIAGHAVASLPLAAPGCAGRRQNRSIVVFCRR